jgi:acyl-CoA thioester hydrolase
MLNVLDHLRAVARPEPLRAVHMMKPDVPGSDQPNELVDFPIVIRLPIQWGDQDAFGHVNNTVPIRWLESSRIAYFEQGNRPLMLDSHKMGPILASIGCNYRRQLHFPDTVRIGARVSRLGRSSLTMEHVVYSETQQAIAADGSSVIVVFNYETNRPIRISDEIRSAIEQFEGKSFA